ncbi:hypothetical protein C8F01DRAFT_8849 [Mycena amicta]|nr:hypothetical protein C8F01DRAFT_8849 [Mycena amicta]
MVFGPISPNPRQRPSHCFQLGGNDVPWVAEHKYVGVWFTSVYRDIFRAHYKHKTAAASYVFWRSVIGCDLYVGRGRLPPVVGLQLYYALIDCHLIHGCDVMLDVDPRSFDQLEDINLAVLRRILGVGHRSGIPQLYSELGVYPLRVRRLELALSYLRYLLKLPQSHLARKALAEADRLRCSGHSSWLGDLHWAMSSFPFSLPRLRSVAHLSVAWCDKTIKHLRKQARSWVHAQVHARVSLSVPSAR